MTKRICAPLRIAAIWLAFVPGAGLADSVHPCLVGLWQADMEDLGHVYGSVMNADSATASGDLRMRIFPNGNASMSTDDLVFDVQMPDTPPMKITAVGGNGFTVHTIDTMVFFQDIEGDLSMTAEVLGMVIPVETNGFLSAGISGEIGCTETGLAIEVGTLGGIPRKWTRLPTPPTGSGLADDES